MHQSNRWLAIGLAVFALKAVASDEYQIESVLIPDDQPASVGLQQTQIYKPHEVAIDQRSVWVSSNERSGFAGITLFHKGSNQVLSFVNIEEPGLDFSEEEEEETLDETAVEELSRGYPFQSCGLLAGQTLSRLRATCERGGRRDHG